ncbi:GOLPH3/VPS74 family protein [Pseudalkalibacillus decolorationis]|uniref:GOLPH3/VPS74 family protein n=1 Tax=Pseudalkalibacillus decolorationis TaxID=163879 RepID=UPI0021474597|nr:GPP34 family phosphoprotein [Pseudalkalibacillus decolorationis]
MFTIPEELLLLALDDEKGTVVFSALSSLNYGLAGAIFAELTILERITLEDKKIVVTNEAPTGDTVLDDVLRRIKESPKERTVDHWIQNSTSWIPQVKKDLLGNLVKKGVLEEKEEKVLWIFTSHKYPTDEEASEQQIRKHIYKSVFENEETDARSGILLSLVKACNLVEEVFTKDKRKEAKKRIDELNQKNDYAKAVHSSIEAMQMAVFLACTTAITISASSSGSGGS